MACLRPITLPQERSSYTKPGIPCSVRVKHVFVHLPQPFPQLIVNLQLCRNPTCAVLPPAKRRTKTILIHKEIRVIRRAQFTYPYRANGERPSRSLYTEYNDRLLSFTQERDAAKSSSIMQHQLQQARLIPRQQDRKKEKVRPEIVRPCSCIVERFGAV